MLPEGLDADAVDRRVGAADADGARTAVLDAHGDRQAAVRRDLLGLLEPQRAEDAEPVQPVEPVLQVVGIERLALGQVRHEGDEVVVDPLAALDVGRAVVRLTARVDGQRDVEQARRMVGDHLAVGLARLGPGQVPPLLDGQRRGLVDEPRPRGLPGAVAGRRRRLDVVALEGRGRSRVDDRRAPEPEARADGDVDDHRHRRLELGGEVGVGDLGAGGADADRRPVVALGVERRQEAPVVAARLRDQPRAARGRALAVRPERGSGLEPALQGLLAPRDAPGDGIGQRIDDLDGLVLLALAPQVDAEDLERGGGHGSEPGNAEHQGHREAALPCARHASLPTAFR